MSPRRRTLTLLALGGLLAAAGVIWFFSRGQGLVDQTLAVQSRLLAGELVGRERKAGVTTVVRNVDKLSRDEVKKVRDGMAQAWRRIQQDGIDAYFAAAPEERDKLLDRDIRRIVTAGELWFATNPRSNGQPPKPRKPKPQDSKQEPKKASSDERLFEAYRIAVQSRARKQGIDLPVWMLTPPRR